MVRNCLVTYVIVSAEQKAIFIGIVMLTCSPNSVNNGARSLKRLFENSSPFQSLCCGVSVGVTNAAVIRLAVAVAGAMSEEKGWE